MKHSSGEGEGALRWENSENFSLITGSLQLLWRLGLAFGFSIHSHLGTAWRIGIPAP
jgi:hypothetical protein